MFYFDDFYGKKVLKSSLLEDCEHFFTTRDFVLMTGTRDDLSDEAASNIDFLVDKFGISKNQLYRCKQMHTANIEVADGVENFFDNTDGIILTKPNTATFLNFADCIPVILYDLKLNLGGVVHAGWRGTAAKIAEKAVQLLVKQGSKPENIVAAIGAGIGKCCFDVNDDVFEKIFAETDKSVAKELGIWSFCEESGKYFIDLKLLNKMILNQASVDRADVADYCTSCKTDVFFSYRKENGNTARHSAVLKLKG